MYPRIKASLYCIFIFGSCISYALPTDKEQIIHVTSDTADLSQQQHTGTYNGHVVFVQGSTNLHAEHAFTKGDIKNRLILAIAKGAKEKQAHYWTEVGPDKPPFHAYADTIKYYPLKHLIELTGNARIEQGPNSLSAAKIIYDIEKQHLISKRDATKRTVIILYPEKK